MVDVLVGESSGKYLLIVLELFCKLEHPKPENNPWCSETIL